MLIQEVFDNYILTEYTGTSCPRPRWTGGAYYP